MIVSFPAIFLSKTGSERGANPSGVPELGSWEMAQLGPFSPY